MGRHDLRSFLDDDNQMAIWLCVKDHLRLLSRSFRVPKESLFFTHETNQVHAPGSKLPREAEGLLIKMGWQTALIAIADLQTSDSYPGKATFTVRFAIVPQQEGVYLFAFREKFFRNASVTKQQVASWVRDRMHPVVRTSIKKRSVEMLYHEKYSALLEDMRNGVLKELEACKREAGIVAYLDEVLFDFPDAKKDLEQDQTLRRAEADAAYRRRLRDIEGKDRKGQLLTEHDLQQYISALQHEKKETEFLHLIEIEKLHRDYMQLRIERRKAEWALRDAIQKEKARYMLPSPAPDPLWALFVALLVVAACAALVLFTFP